MRLARLLLISGLAARAVAGAAADDVSPSRWSFRALTGFGRDDGAPAADVADDDAGAFGQKASYDENGAGDQDAGYLAGFLKDVLDSASPTTWTPHSNSHVGKILNFLKDDIVGTPREATLWRRATLYNTFAKLQE